MAELYLFVLRIRDTEYEILYRYIFLAYFKYFWSFGVVFCVFLFFLYKNEY